MENYEPLFLCTKAMSVVGPLVSVKGNCNGIAYKENSRQHRNFVKNLGKTLI